MKRVFILFQEKPICFSSKTKLYNYLLENFAKNFFPGEDYIQIRSDSGKFKNINCITSFNEVMRENKDSLLFVVLPGLMSEQIVPIIYTCKIN